MMINSLSCIFTIAVALLAPIGVSVWLALKKKGYLKPILFGALTFFVFQIVFRVPILQYVLPKMHWYAVMSMIPWASALFLGITASLVEEGGRWIVMRLFLKDRMHVRYGIAFGIGHGGIEAVLLAGINALAVLITMPGAVGAGLMFAGGIERISAITFHIGMSVMVQKSIREKNTWWLLAAFLLHAALDAAVVLASAGGVSIPVIEVALLALSAAIAVFIINQYKKYKENI